jgi:sulfur relay (sulfurtransferase) complex TusBCD TusD component (DsrE family)
MGRPPLNGRRLAIIVSTAPDRGDFERAERLARAARVRGVDVGIFLMDAAVVWGAHERASRLVNEDGCDLFLCGTNAGKLGVALAPGVVNGVVVGSQDDHAALVHRADRVVAFT